VKFREGFVKNRYIGRTFIEPTEALRRKGVALKFNVMPGAIAGKRIVVVDDSIVRGTTTGPIVRLLRDAGAASVHVRIASPPIRHPCHMGVDMGSYEELAAHRMDLEGIRAAVGADSLAYLSLAGLGSALGNGKGAALPGSGFCLACFSGDYPVDVAQCAVKDGFEAC
jgi:amidophosphoribosyltransferase